MPLSPVLRLGIGTLSIVGCGSYEFPRPRIPQVESTVEMVEGQGDRFAAHRTCVRANPELKPLLECMDTAGYAFVARVPQYPSIECWQLRERAGTDLPPAYCWERGPSTPPR
jgi:hypothetical protein